MGGTVFTLVMELTDLHALNRILDTVSTKLKQVAKFYFAFGFVLKNVEDKICW